eukprot:2683401-Amphidinium_carterae.1
MSVKQVLLDRALEWSDFNGPPGNPGALDFVKTAVQRNHDVVRGLELAYAAKGGGQRGYAVWSELSMLQPL